MVSVFSSRVYGSWKEKQLEKYEDLLPVLLEVLPRVLRVLDVGVGRAWFEKFLLDNGFVLERVVGVDVDEDMVEPRKKFVEYHLTNDFRTGEEFDLLVCFDSYHLLPEDYLDRFKARFVLVSVPKHFSATLKRLKGRIIRKGVIGRQEEDVFVLVERGF